MLNVTNISCERNHSLLFSKLTFELKPGKLALVTGGNGVGKSSLLQIIAGALLPIDGEVLLQRRFIPKSYEYKDNLLYLSHKENFHPDLSARENLHYALLIRNQTNKRSEQQIELALNNLQLNKQAGIPMGELSAGQKQRVAMALLTLVTAKLWVLDEPSANLDDTGVVLLQNLVLQHLATGGVAVIATHVLQDRFKQVALHVPITN